MLKTLENLVSQEAEPVHIAAFTALISHKASANESPLDTGFRSALFGRLKTITDQAALVDTSASESDLVLVVDLFAKFIGALYTAIPECKTLNIVQTVIVSNVLSVRVIAGSLVACFTKYSTEMQSHNGLEKIVTSLFEFLPATLMEHEHNMLLQCLSKPELVATIWHWLDNLFTKTMYIAQ